MMGDVGRPRTDDRATTSAGAQFCQSHSYRHSSTLFQGFDAVRVEEVDTRLPHLAIRTENEDLFKCNSVNHDVAL
jgi:hypothetical protein